MKVGKKDSGIVVSKGQISMVTKWLPGTKYDV
jgi:hypothetical protein